jgi:aspartate/methionine/tyrosine aminotransferase
MATIRQQYRIVVRPEVAVIPGTTFGMNQFGMNQFGRTQDRYVRVAYGSLQPKTAIAGMGRLVAGLRAMV